MGGTGKEVKGKGGAEWKEEGKREGRKGREGKGKGRRVGTTPNKKLVTGLHPVLPPKSKRFFIGPCGIFTPNFEKIG